mmetsp:Transcript_30579/g.64454  ORF Transcript_30579/g.64454 Transcript_30579/m.64454 type:complete len:237 (+) Transcript_30579:880-1590(+)
MLHAEHGSSGSQEGDIGRFACFGTFLAKGIFQNPHDFLGCTGALEGCGGKREEILGWVSRIETRVIFHGVESVPCLFAGVSIVNGNDTTIFLGQSLLKAGNGIPINLHPRRDDEVVVIHGASVVESDLVCFGFESFDSFLDPFSSLGNDIFHGFFAVLAVGQATSHESPEGLVVVDLGRFDDGDVVHAFVLKHGRDAKSGGSSTDNDYFFGALFAKIGIGHDVDASCDGDTGGCLQ